jgi:DNA-directed RNA polymerase subunit M/transcription elongation factor TFIIS
MVIRHAAQTFPEAREYVIRKLFLYFQDVKTAKNVEKQIMEYTKHKLQNVNSQELLSWNDIQVRRTYCRKARSIIYNLSSKNSLKPAQTDSITSRTPREWCPSLWEPIYKKFSDREKLSLIMDSEDTHQGILQCEQCFSYRTRYIELQTRSADEPMTVYATCLDCMSHWTL